MLTTNRRKGGKRGNHFTLGKKEGEGGPGSTTSFPLGPQKGEGEGSSPEPRSQEKRRGGEERN